jgi:hypothetical protein
MQSHSAYWEACQGLSSATGLEPEGSVARAHSPPRGVRRQPSSFCGPPSDSRSYCRDGGRPEYRTTHTRSGAGRTARHAGRAVVGPPAASASRWKASTVARSGAPVVRLPTCRAPDLLGEIHLARSANRSPFGLTSAIHRPGLDGSGQTAKHWRNVARHQLTPSTGDPDRSADASPMG